MSKYSGFIQIPELSFCFLNREQVYFSSDTMNVVKLDRGFHFISQLPTKIYGSEIIQILWPTAIINNKQYPLILAYGHYNNFYVHSVIVTLKQNGISKPICKHSFVRVPDNIINVLEKNDTLVVLEETYRFKVRIRQ